MDMCRWCSRSRALTWIGGGLVLSILPVLLTIAHEFSSSVTDTLSYFKWRDNPYFILRRAMPFGALMGVLHEEVVAIEVQPNSSQPGLAIRTDSFANSTTIVLRMNSPEPGELTELSPSVITAKPTQYSEWLLCGFPLHSFWASASCEVSEIYARDAATVRYGIVLDKNAPYSPGPPALLVSTIPLGIRPVGLFINWIVGILCIALIDSAWSWCRRTRRVRGGKCPSCGYEVAHASRCPECGQLRSRSCLAARGS